MKQKKAVSGIELSKGPRKLPLYTKRIHTTLFLLIILTINNFPNMSLNFHITKQKMEDDVIFDHRIEKYTPKEVDSASPGDPISIGAEMGDNLTYAIDFEGAEPEYLLMKVNSTDVSDPANITIYLNNYSYNLTHPLDQVNATYTNYTLNGTISKNLMGSQTFFHPILPIGTNFTENLEEIETEWDIIEGGKIEVDSGVYGYSLSVSFYYRVLILILIMRLQCFYSSQGILLLNRMTFHNPINGTTINANITLLPENSSVESRFENPFSPEGVPPQDQNHPDDYISSNDGNSGGNIWDTTAVFSVIGIFLGIATFVTGIILLYRWRKRKINLRKNSQQIEL